MKGFCRVEYGKPKKGCNRYEYFTSYETQKNKFTINGVEYQNIEEIPEIYIETVKRTVLKYPSTEKFNFIFHCIPIIELYNYRFFSKERKFYLGLFILLVFILLITTPYMSTTLTLLSLYSISCALLFFIFAGRGFHPRWILLPSFPVMLAIGKILGIKDEVLNIPWEVVITMLFILSLPIVLSEIYKKLKNSYIITKQ